MLILNTKMIAIAQLIGSDLRSRRLSALMIAVMTIFGSSLVPSPAHAQSEEDQTEAIRLFNVAQDSHEKGDLTRAIEIYTEALEKFAEFPEAAFQRGMAQRQLGRSADAEKSFRLAIEMNPEWSLALTSLATVLLDRNEIREAESLLVRAIDSDPDNPPALAAMADLKLRANADPKALDELLAKITRLASKANPTTQILLAKAAVEERLGRRADARSTLEKIIAADPDNFQANVALIEILAHDRDLLRSKALLEKLVVKHPNRDKDRTLYLKAVIFAADGKLAEANTAIDQMSAQTAASQDLRTRIANADSTDAKELETMLANEPNNASILSRLCGLYRRQDPNRAMEMCRRASEIEPSNVEHSIGYAAALVQGKRFEEAVVILERVVAKSPDNTTARANLATALFQLKRYEEAKKEFLWLSEKQPDNPAPLYFLAIIYDQLTDYIDALANYQAYLRMADPAKNQDEIERINLRLPAVQKLVKDGKGRKRR